MKKQKKQPVKWIGQWSDYADSVRDLASTLRGYGIRAKAADESIYVGHRMLKIDASQKKEAKKILRSISSHGKFIAKECLNPTGYGYC